MKRALNSEADRSLLAAALERAAPDGSLQLVARLRHGEFVATLAETEADAALCVLGEHHHASGAAEVHTDCRLERAIRAVKRPRSWLPPRPSTRRGASR